MRLRGPRAPAIGLLAPLLAALTGCQATPAQRGAARMQAPVAAPASAPLPGTAPIPDSTAEQPAPAPISTPAPPATPTVEKPAPVTVAPPPCACAQAAPKPKPKRRKAKFTAPVSEPQSVGPAPPPADAVVDAEVGRVDAPLTSILGKDVFSPKGENLGRIVDLLSDPEGRVRVAIIDFGGFLGVGTRRIAVDWPLLHFAPADKNKPLMLTVTREKLQSAPEYKDATRPRVLMPPATGSDGSGADAKR